MMARFMLGAILATGLASCSHAAPVSATSCIGDVRKDHVVYRFTIANNEDKAAASVRINFRGLSGTALTYDYAHVLPEKASAIVEFPTGGLPRSVKPLQTAPVPCSVVAVRYTDGSTWALAPGVATP